MTKTDFKYFTAMLPRLTWVTLPLWITLGVGLAWGKPLWSAILTGIVVSLGGYATTIAVVFVIWYILKMIGG